MRMANGETERDFSTLNTNRLYTFCEYDRPRGGNDDNDDDFSFCCAIFSDDSLKLFTLLGTSKYREHSAIVCV